MNVELLLRCHPQRRARFSPRKPKECRDWLVVECRAVFCQQSRRSETIDNVAMSCAELTLPFLRHCLRRARGHGRDLQRYRCSITEPIANAAMLSSGCSLALDVLFPQATCGAWVPGPFAIPSSSRVVQSSGAVVEPDTECPYRA